MCLTCIEPNHVVEYLVLTIGHEFPKGICTTIIRKRKKKIKIYRTGAYSCNYTNQQVVLVIYISSMQDKYQIEINFVSSNFVQFFFKVQKLKLRTSMHD